MKNYKGLILIIFGLVCLITSFGITNHLYYMASHPVFIKSLNLHMDYVIDPGHTLWLGFLAGIGFMSVIIGFLVSFNKNKNDNTSKYYFD